MVNNFFYIYREHFISDKGHHDPGEYDELDVSIPSTLRSSFKGHHDPGEYDELDVSIPSSLRSSFIVDTDVSPITLPGSPLDTMQGIATSTPNR